MFSAMRVYNQCIGQVFPRRLTSGGIFKDRLKNNKLSLFLLFSEVFFGGQGCDRGGHNCDRGIPQSHQGKPRWGDIKSAFVDDSALTVYHDFCGGGAAIASVH